MNQYEKEIQALKYRCRKLEQQCSMFDDTFQKQNHLLFLHDFRVPATNNEAERLLRNYKLKQAQARKPMALTVISLHHRFFCYSKIQPVHRLSLPDYYPGRLQQPDLWLIVPLVLLRTG